jgi:acyl-CoA synthetase (AMP-forming)/AMP-acid ligase II/acyl carrier protein
MIYDPLTVGEDKQTVRKIVRTPFRDYLRTSTDLVKKANWFSPALNTSIQNGSKIAEDAQDLDELTAEDSEAVLDHAFERYFHSNGLFGSPEDCLKLIRELKAIGVTEIGCLIDFGIPVEDVISSLPYLNRLRELSQSPKQETSGDDFSIPAQIQYHGVTHLQCTPSLAQVIIDSPGIGERFSKLHTVLLGGEALPEKLAENFLDVLPKEGRLFNMYGPTETTVWSSTSHVRKHELITIGSPIANTSIHLLDEHMVPVPLGVPGHLYIGGAGVVRGYLGQETLTRENFLQDPSVEDSRIYRTGDLARFLPNGQLQYLGRSDHQIKLNGHRIELGEIEAALVKHPDVEQAVVLGRTIVPDNPQLIAYLRRRIAVDKSDTSTLASRIEFWRTIWQEVYQKDGGNQKEPLSKTTFNTFGWISSYTGLPIPIEEMKEWVNETVEKISALKPKRLLEIGCGSGLLLFRLANRCERYTAVDFSSSAIEEIKLECERMRLKQVELINTVADDLRGVPSDSYDVVVMNSVAQYFPDVDYLEKVLVSAIAKLIPGGFLFVGDIRNFDLMRTFHLSVELREAPEDRLIAELKERIDRLGRYERELLIAPDYFKAFAQKYTLDIFSISAKRGVSSNEMNDFRYDAVLQKRRTEAEEAPQSNIYTETDSRNSRSVYSIRAEELMDSGAFNTVSDLREAMATMAQNGIEIKQNPSEGSAFEDKPLAEYANTPAVANADSELIGELQVKLGNELPDYMVPSSFMVLDSFPLTPNGKVDRNALPNPLATQALANDRSDEQAVDELEASIVQVWRNILNLDLVDVENSFFNLGANSLKMMRAANQLRKVLNVQLSLRELFDHPTVKELAAYLRERD